MSKIDWCNYDEENLHQLRSRGCGYLFLLIIILCIPIGFLFLKTIDSFINDPREQIRSQISDFVDIPAYDPRDNSFSVEKIDQPSEDMVLYEVKIIKNENGSMGGEYSFIVKARIKKRLFFSSKIEIIEAFKD
ncbi:hypothetical protein BAU15_06390 [Enterococcus sp. JM4C]|uniref:hypothetical protein n=1 Tax=Candidatus Enterococcus huntleyi TaxID=1857217 RepID=UPI00137B5273|nr:hypothetical protein [Enterococcus sp. JM4C]KAF1297173.1 hypothetical protein BAU15_06390 [Enterococcus sp. JM4C]